MGVTEDTSNCFKHSLEVVYEVVVSQKIVLKSAISSSLCLRYEHCTAIKSKLLITSANSSAL